MADNAYRTPEAPVRDRDTGTLSTSLPAAVAAGLAVALFAMGVLGAVFVAASGLDLSGSPSPSQLAERLRALPHVTAWLVALRAAGGAAGGWFAGRVTQRWLAASLSIGGLLGALPLASSFAMSQTVDLAMVGGYLLGAVPAGWLAARAARHS